MRPNTSRYHKACVECGKPGRVGAGLSVRGLCAVCGPKRQAEAIRQMAEKSGPYWDQYVASMRNYALRELAQTG